MTLTTETAPKQRKKHEPNLLERAMRDHWGRGSKLSFSNKIERMKRLDALEREIRSLADTTDKLIRSARDKCREAYTEALLCGKALIEAKSILPHGVWGLWLKEKCGGISESTAQRYMRVAKSVNTDGFEKHNTLSEHYVAIGIIDAPQRQRALPPPAIDVDAKVEPAAPEVVPPVQARSMREVTFNVTSSDTPAPANVETTAEERAANACGVSIDEVRAAAKIRAENPVLFEQLENGAERTNRMLRVDFLAEAIEVFVRDNPDLSINAISRLRAKLDELEAKERQAA